MTIPPALAAHLSSLFGESPQAIRVVSGGDISVAARFDAGGQTYLVKWLPAHPHRPRGWPSMFQAEARGLIELRRAQAVCVPSVLAHGDSGRGEPDLLLMDWIEPSPQPDRAAAGRLLGWQLALQHRVTTDSYGLDHHNYCGASPQDNTQTSDWIEFYGQHRLAFQMELAGQRGLMPAERARQLVRLIDRLGEWIDPVATQPSLLHGDLWGGNWLITTGNLPALIDPAMYFGDREAELAMCHLFGGFPREFYQAYDEAWPPAPGRSDRIALYQLYHLLNHLNLFGEGYGTQVDAVLRRYAG